MTLVITEKGKQAGYIKKLMNSVQDDKHGLIRGVYEGIDFLVCPLQGHVFEQDKSGVDLCNFAPPAEILKRIPKMEGSYKKIHDRLKYVQKYYFGEIDSILLATDPDLEGCAIGKEVLEYYRFDACNDITYMDIANTSEKALRKALDTALRTRKDHLDWERFAFGAMLKGDFSLTGLAISHTMNAFSQKKNVNVFYTFGTQQIRALDLVVERYREYKAFDRSDHYRIKLHTPKGIFVYEDDGDTKDKARIEMLAEGISGKRLHISSMQTKDAEVRSPKWFDGSQLGSKVAKQTKISIAEIFSNKTSVMQRMYEGGLITYIRGEAKGKMPMVDLPQYAEIAKHIAKYYKADRLNTDLVKPYLWRKENSKEKVNHTPCTLADTIDIGKYSGAERAVLDHASRQILATFYPDAIVRKYAAIGEIDRLQFVLKDEETLDSGWQEIYEIKPKTLNNDRTREISEDEVLQIDRVEVEKYQKTPPPLFTEETLLDEIKKKGIGAESTFGEIINFILDRQKGANNKKIIREYCELNKKKQILPTEKGMNFVDHIPDKLKNVMMLFENGVLKLYIDGEMDEEEALKSKNKISSILYTELTKMFEENFSSFSAFGRKYEKFEKKEYAATTLLCPICSGKIIEKEAVFQCENGKMKKVGKTWINDGCEFNVFKNSKRGYIYTLNQSTLEELLDEGVTRIDAYNEKSGIEQKVRLKFTDDYKKVELISQVL